MIQVRPKLLKTLIDALAEDGFCSIQFPAHIYVLTALAAEHEDNRLIDKVGLDV